MIQNRSTDRILELSVIDGEKPKSSTGQLDSRLFTGGQRLHLKMNPETCLWSFQYSHGGLLPGGLDGQYTGFKAGLKVAEEYFRKRNVKITRVND